MRTPALGPERQYRPVTRTRSWGETDLLQIPLRRDGPTTEVQWARPLPGAFGEGTIWSGRNMRTDPERLCRDLGGAMLRSTRVLKFAAAVVATVTLLGATTTRSRAQTTGRISLHIVKAGFIVGVGGGDGVLLYHGRRYHLAVGGVGVGSLGIAAVDLRGTASNLRSPVSISGTYGGAGAGATFIAGGQVATLQNGNGVVLRLRGAQIGFQVSLGLAGMTIVLR